MPQQVPFRIVHVKLKTPINDVFSDAVDPALRFEKWETLDLISKNRLITFLQVMLLPLLPRNMSHRPVADASSEARAPGLRPAVVAAAGGRVRADTVVAARCVLRCTHLPRTSRGKCNTRCRQAWTLCVFSRCASPRRSIHTNCAV